MHTADNAVSIGFRHLHHPADLVIPEPLAHQITCHLLLLSIIRGIRFKLLFPKKGLDCRLRVFPVIVFLQRLRSCFPVNPLPAQGGIEFCTALPVLSPLDKTTGILPVIQIAERCNALAFALFSITF